MRKIPKKFTKYCFEYKLLKRVGMIVIFEQSSGGGVDAYEVHKVREKRLQVVKYRKPDGTYNEIIHKATEVLATNAEFGRFGWTFIKKENAEEKFKELVEEHDKIRRNLQKRKKA